MRLAPVLLLAAGVTLFHWRGLQPGYTFLPVDLARTILPWGDGSPRILQNWLISDATAAAPAMLVLADRHYPGWEARVMAS
jgi:hypothetical protein